MPARSGIDARIGAVVVAWAFAGCAVDPIEFTPLGPPPAEDCAAPGDEDGNGAADCTDPVCAAEPSCRPRCDDGVRNGTETDVDCGGGCGPCGAGRACASDADCTASTVCEPLVCRPARSCAELQLRRPAAGDGVYQIEPSSAQPPFDALCDMTRDGGGWTLLLKATGDATFAHGAPAWTDDTLVAPDDLTRQPGSSKYRSFLSLPISVLRGELDGFRFTHAVTGPSARAIFSGQAAIVDSFPTFNTGAPGWSTQPNCQVFGVNTPHGYALARFGWSANQENDCLTNDTAIGFGLTYASQSRGAGYICGSSLCSAGNVDIGGNGLLWGR